MRTRFHLVLNTLILAALATVAGCASSPNARFYTLTPLASPETPPSAKSGAPVSVSVAPVEVPDYLDRPQIVTREGANGVKLAEFDRWAGSLGENMSAVLAEDLAQLLGTDRVFVDAGGPGGKADYSVAMRVLRLDCLPGDHVLLKAQWTVTGPGGKNGATRVSNVIEKLNDGRYDTMVAAVDRAVERVSREIVREIQPR